MAKQKKIKPIYVSSKNDPKLKSYQDSLSLYNKTKSFINLVKKSGGSSDLTPYAEAQHNLRDKSKIKPIGSLEGWVMGPTGGYAYEVYKKPTQPVVYQERTYQKESNPIKSKSIKGLDSKLPDLKKVEGPSKWMRSFGAGANQNYWSKVDAQGMPLPGYTTPNQNAVAQPQGPGPDYQVRESVPLGMTQFNKDKK